MRTLLLLGWLVIPIGVAAYHFGPGQELLPLDEVTVTLARAEQQLAAHDWKAAQSSLDEALKQLPADQVAARRRIRIERAKAQMFADGLSSAEADLGSLVAEIQADPKADPDSARAAREALANAQFYMTWRMRVEGQPRSVWEPEIEAARQNYRLLAEQATLAGDQEAGRRNREDLASAIRLARMEIKDLQGLPLPNQ